MKTESTIKLLAVVEATTVNAVAKNMLEFSRTARELEFESTDSPRIETSFVTFDRRSNDDENESPNEFVTAARAFGLEVDVIRERKRFDLRVIPALREAIERRAPDLILTHQVKSHLLIKLSRLWQRYPWVAFHHGYTRTQLRERLYNRMNRLSLPTAHRVVTVCEAFAQDIAARERVPMNRISVQHNSIRAEQGVDEEEARLLRTQLGIVEDERVVLAVGRLSSEKAHADLLSAFHHLRETHPEIKAQLVIVGDGPEREKLERAARVLRINERVHFTGQLSDVRPFYALAQVMALPSHSEGSPYVLLEAMAARLPVVATRVGGVPEMVVDEESALLVPARDTRAMAAGLARVLTDAQLADKLTSNAARLVATRYSPEVYARSLIEIYREIIESAHSPGSK